MNQQEPEVNAESAPQTAKQGNKNGAAKTSLLRPARSASSILVNPAVNSSFAGGGDKENTNNSSLPLHDRNSLANVSAVASTPMSLLEQPLSESSRRSRSKLISYKEPKLNQYVTFFQLFVLVRKNAWKIYS